MDKMRNIEYVTQRMSRVVQSARTLEQLYTAEIYCNMLAMRSNLFSGDICGSINSIIKTKIKAVKAANLRRNGNETTL